MDQRLVEVARVGDVMALHRIMETDPEILEKESFGHSADSALHVAARRGKSEFVKKNVSLTPSLATATNQKGLIPLHMASAQGHVETVKELLKAKLDDEEVAMNQCLVKEDDGWNPLHYAVSKRRIGVVKELINHCPECVEQVTAKGETVLHLAVKANQLKVLQVIVESIKDGLPNFQALFKTKDVNANTVSDLAPTKKTFLVRLKKGKEEEKDEIKEESSITVEALEDGSFSDGGGDEGEAAENHKEEKQEAAGFREFQNAVLVVATLIITLTCQGLANPPTTLFQPAGEETDWSCLSRLYLSSLISLNFSEMMKFYKTCRAYLALSFLVCDTIIFTLSILLLLSNLRGAYGSLLLLRFLAFFLIFNYCVILEAITSYGAYATVAIVYPSFPFLLYLLYREKSWIGEKLRRIWGKKH